MTGDRGGSAETLWTPANIITLLRICLVPVFVVAMISPWPQWFGLSWISDEAKSLIAAIIFILISCTDWIDGYLARKRNEVTDFGKFIDPLADKILVMAALIALVELQVLPSWPVLIILARDLVVSGVRMMAASRGVVIAASWYGKAKTVFQIIAIILFLVKDSLYLPSPGDALGNPLYVISWVVMGIALFLTLLSMMDYLSKARHIIGLDTSDKADEPATAAPSVEVLQATVHERARQVIADATQKSLTIGTAESLTGGLISSALTEIPGSSAVVRGGVVSYAIGVKHDVLGVNQSILDTEGAVCEDTAVQMAEGARQRLSSSMAVAVTGIAGPTGAEPGKPVGTVWIGLATASSVQAHVHCFPGDRDQVRLQTVAAALDQLLDTIRRW